MRHGHTGRGALRAPESTSASSAATDPAVASLSAAFGQDAAAAMTSEERRCTAGRLVQQVGPERLVAWRILDASHVHATLRDAPQAFVDARARALSSCVGLHVLSVRRMRADARANARTAAGERRIGRAVGRCQQAAAG